MVDGLRGLECCPEVALGDFVKPRLMDGPYCDADASSRRRSIAERCPYETPLRGDMRSEGRARVVHDSGRSPQLTVRLSLLRRRQRRPCLVQVVAANLRSRGPAVPGWRPPRGPLGSDLPRQSAHERGLAGHVDGCMRDPHGDAVTDPCSFHSSIRLLAASE